MPRGDVLRDLCITALLIPALAGQFGQEEKNAKAELSKKLRGVWKVVDEPNIGQKKPTYDRFVFDGDTLTFHTVSGPSVKCTFKAQPGPSHHSLDFTPQAGGNAGKSYFGIFELKETQLRVAYRGPGATRPKDFNDIVDGEGYATYFIVLKRSMSH